MLFYDQIDHKITINIMHISITNLLKCLSLSLCIFTITNFSNIKKRLSLQ